MPDPAKAHLHEMGTFVAADAEEKNQAKERHDKEQKRREYDEYRVSERMDESRTVLY